MPILMVALKLWLCWVEAFSKPLYGVKIQHFPSQPSKQLHYQRSQEHLRWKIQCIPYKSVKFWLNRDTKICKWLCFPHHGTESPFILWTEIQKHFPKAIRWISITRCKFSFRAEHIHPFAQPLALTLIPILVAPEHPIASDENARVLWFLFFNLII